MGVDAIIYGRIVAPYLTWPEERNGRLIQSRNAEVIAALPADDPRPSLARGMFAVPSWTGGIFLNQVIPLGASFDDDMMSRDWWDTWLEKFESLLRRLYWDSVVLHMESTLDGHRMFQWLPTKRAAGLTWADEPQPVNEWNRTDQTLFGDRPTEQGTSGQQEKIDSRLIRVRIPLPLRQYTEGAAVVQVGGYTVQAVLEALSQQFSDLTPILFSEGRVNICLNDEDIRFLDEGTATAVTGGDEVTIVLQIVGA